MLKCLAPLFGFGGSQVSFEPITNKYNNAMKKRQEAVEVALSIHSSIDDYRFPKDIRIQHQSLGQVLRSLLEILENERGNNQNTAT